jgi:hypothetical protein
VVVVGSVVVVVVTLRRCTVVEVVDEGAEPPKSELAANHPSPRTVMTTAPAKI